MAKIISFANQKGGVGKTTTVATLGSIFAKVGVRVLMVDLDAQCNLTDTFLSEVEGPTVYEVFKDRRDYRPTRIKDGLDILPASLDMSALDLIIGGQFEKERILSDVHIRKVRSRPSGLPAVARTRDRERACSCGRGICAHRPGGLSSEGTRET